MAVIINVQIAHVPLCCHCPAADEVSVHFRTIDAMAEVLYLWQSADLVVHLSVLPIQEYFSLSYVSLMRF